MKLDLLVPIQRTGRFKDGINHNRGVLFYQCCDQELTILPTAEFMCSIKVA